jgi:uncharacterized membrane protein (UPF0127 family)
MDNATRKQLLQRHRMSGFPGSILDVFRAHDQGVDLIGQFEQQQQQQQQNMQVASTPQEQEQGLRPAHQAGNVSQSMVFPNVPPNTPFNTKGMKAPINIRKYDEQGHLVKSYENVPPGISSLPTGPQGGTVIETPANMQSGGGLINAGLSPLITVRGLVQEGKRRIADNLFPSGYASESQNKLPEQRLYDALILNQPEPSSRADLGPRPENPSRRYLSLEERGNLLGYAMGQNDNLPPADYKPSDAQDTDAVYFKSPTTEQNLIEKLESEEDALKWINRQTADGDGGIDYHTGVDLNVLGNYTLDKGQDDKGHYISYYDIWDLDPFKDKTRKAVSDAVQNIAGVRSPEVYGRIYYDPETGKPITEKKQTGGAKEDYNMARAQELGYKPDATGHYPSVDDETGDYLKSKKHPTAWKEYLHSQLSLDPFFRKNTTVADPEGYFGENQLKYVPRKFQNAGALEFGQTGPDFETYGPGLRIDGETYQASRNTGATRVPLFEDGTQRPILLGAAEIYDRPEDSGIDSIDEALAKTGAGTIGQADSQEINRQVSEMNESSKPFYQTFGKTLGAIAAPMALPSLAASGFRGLAAAGEASYPYLGGPVNTALNTSIGGVTGLTAQNILNSGFAANAGIRLTGADGGENALDVARDPNRSGLDKAGYFGTRGLELLPLAGAYSQGAREAASGLGAFSQSSAGAKINAVLEAPGRARRALFGRPLNAAEFNQLEAAGKQYNINIDPYFHGAKLIGKDRKALLQMPRAMRQSAEDFKRLYADPTSPNRVRINESARQAFASMPDDLVNKRFNNLMTGLPMYRQNPAFAAMTTPDAKRQGLLKAYNTRFDAYANLGDQMHLTARSPSGPLSYGVRQRNGDMHIFTGRPGRRENLSLFSGVSNPQNRINRAISTADHEIYHSGTELYSQSGIDLFSPFYKKASSLINNKIPTKYAEPGNSLETYRNYLTNMEELGARSYEARRQLAHFGDPYSIGGLKQMEQAIRSNSAAAEKFNEIAGQTFLSGRRSGLNFLDRKLRLRRDPGYMNNLFNKDAGFAMLNNPHLSIAKGLNQPQRQALTSIELLRTLPAVGGIGVGVGLSQQGGQ